MLRNDKRRKADVDLKAPVGRPVCPDHIREDEVALKQWERTCDHLESMGILAECDDHIIEQFASLYSLWVQAKDNVKKVGAVVEQGVGLKQSPYVQIYLSLHQSLMRMLTELGLSPAARARLRITKEEKKQNKWEGIIGPIRSA